MNQVTKVAIIVIFTFLVRFFLYIYVQGMMAVLGILLLYFIYLIVGGYFLIRWIFKRRFKTTAIALFSNIIGVFLISQMFFKTNLEKIDWYINKNKFKQIVILAKNNRLQEINDSDVRKLYHIPKELRLFPPFRDNTVEIIAKGATLNLYYYADRGFIDHSSFFMYTDNRGDSVEYDRFVKKRYELEDNWYLIVSI